jgi:hypothetical protein
MPYARNCHPSHPGTPGDLTRPGAAARGHGVDPTPHLQVRPHPSVNTPGDIHEQHADRVADQVMRMPEPLQRCACGGGCPACQRQAVQRRGLEPGVAVPIVDDVLRSPGQPLDAEARGFMESRFGYDFSRVRVHADAKAASSSRAVNALAYTVGEHVVFAADRYRPGTSSGKRLIAHELAHVVQQSKGPVVLQRQATPSSDLKDISNELEAIRLQIAEGAEDLEIVRWQMALAGQTLPKGTSGINASTAAFVEAAIETSTAIGPFVRGKLAKTSVARGFKIYDSPKDFEASLGTPRGKPSIGQARPTTRTRGFFHRGTDSIHLPPDAKFGHALHEGIHKYSSIALQNAVGISVNEGFTQIFTDDVLAEHGLGSVSHAYGAELECAKIVLGWINNDKPALARAYFQEGHANPILQEVMRRLRIVTAQEINNLKAGDGMGLCKRITQAGP